MPEKKTYYLRSSTRWLLSVTFLLSFFSFSGYAGLSSIKQTINPIELVSDTKSEIGKRSITYKNVVGQSNDSSIRNFSESCQLYSLRAYNQLEKVKFDDCFIQTCPILFANLLYQVARVQQNSKEYPSPIALG